MVCSQRSVARARSGLPYERPVQKTLGTKWTYAGYPSHDGCAAKTLMSLPAASVTPAAAAGVTPAASDTPAGTHIEEID